MTGLSFGRLLRAGTTGFVIGCRVTEPETPEFGALVRVPLAQDYQVYGIIYDIHIDDDGLVRQLVTTDTVDQAVIADNRFNRNVPIEMSVLAVGYSQAGEIRHLLPPRPPLSLDEIYVCDAAELCRFTASGRCLATCGTFCAPANCQLASCWLRISNRLTPPNRLSATRAGPPAPPRS